MVACCLLTVVTSKLTHKWLVACGHTNEHLENTVQLKCNRSMELLAAGNRKC